MPIDRDSILAAQDRRGEAVSVPEWGGVVWAKSLSGTERDLLEQAVFAAKAEGQADPLFTARVVALGAHDEGGAKLFRPGDEAALAQKDAAALSRVAGAVLRLSGMDAGAKERAEKNSANAPS